MDVKQFLRNPNQTIGVEICSTLEGMRIFCCHLKKDKGNVLLLESIEVKSSELIAYLDKKNLGFRLLFSGKGVLMQTTSTLKSDDFYNQEYKEYNYIIRKDSISQEFNALQNRIQYGGTLLGASPLAWAIDFLSISTIQSFCYDDQNAKANWDLPSKELEIAGQRIESKYVGAYFTGLSLFFEEAIPTANPSETARYYENNSLKKSLLVFGVAILVVAIVNFFVFDYLNTENLELSNNNQNSSQLTEEYNSLQKDIKLKSQLMNDLGVNKKQSRSFYSDRIAFSVPKSIVIDQCNIAPLNEEKVKKEGLLEFNKSQIHVSGYTDSATDFNLWLDQIKTFQWVNKVEVENYKFDTQNSHSLFNLNIVLK